MSNTPHDALFRATFSVASRARGLLRRILPKRLVHAILWTTLESVQGVFVDRRLDPHATDLLFRAELAGCPGRRVYLLIEHQSGVDPDMPLRVIDYQLQIWTQLRKDCRPGELPTVVSVVVSHAVGGWTGPRSLDDVLSDPPESLGVVGHVPRFTMLLLDLADAADHELRSIEVDAFGVATLWALRESRNGTALIDQFADYADILRAMAAGPHGRDDCHTWLRYILDVADDAMAEQLVAAVHQYTPELEEIAMTAAEKLRQEGREQGRRNQIAMLVVLLTQRFGPIPAAQRERLDTATPEQLNEYAGRILTVRSLDELFAE
jgi:hypothetical protein